MAAEYNPRGRGKILLDAMRAEPDRIWNVREIAALLGVATNTVTAYTLYAQRAEVIHRGKRDGQTVFALKAFPPEEADAPKRRVAQAGCWTPSADDIRIPRVVPGWHPPVMVAPRVGSAR